jgi:integrase
MSFLTSTLTGRRDHALLLIASQTGLRVSELTALRRHAVRLGTVFCPRQQPRGRCVPLTTQAVKVLTVWLRDRAVQDDGPVFPPTVAVSSAQVIAIATRTLDTTVLTAGRAKNGVCPSENEAMSLTLGPLLMRSARCWRARRTVAIGHLSIHPGDGGRHGGRGESRARVGAQGQVWR